MVDNLSAEQKKEMAETIFQGLLARQVLRLIMGNILDEQDSSAESMPAPTPKADTAETKERPVVASSNGALSAVERAQATIEQREEDERNHVVAKSKEVAKQDVPEVTHKGKQIILPEGMSLEEGIVTLDRRLQHDEKLVTFNATVQAFPWDGAYALHQVLLKRYGWTEQKAQMTFFGPEPPTLMSIETGIASRVEVPWGDVRIPGIDGVLSTGAEMKKDQWCFSLRASIRRKFLPEMTAIVQALEAYLKIGSLYRGKSIKISFLDQAGHRREIPEVSFLDVQNASLNNLVFNEFVERQVRTSVFAPLEKRHLLASLGIQFKRGVLLAGSYGVGKTELAYAAARTANEHEIAFILCEDPRMFSQTVAFAQQYAPAIVFCEDIDRVTSGGRTAEVDQILNTVDGIEAKAAEIMIVLTTNEVEEIHEAMIRPGRIDAVIVIDTPDASSVVRLLKLYGHGLIGENENLDAIGEELAGQIPAVIREVVERSKLGALDRGDTEDDMVLVAEDLLYSARSMTRQLQLLEKRTVPEPLEEAVAIVGLAFNRDI